MTTPTDFIALDDSAAESGYATDGGLLDQIRVNQRVVWDALGDTLVQQMERVTRTSFEWVLIWSTPWYWMPGDKQIEVALLAERVADGEGNCVIEVGFAFSALGEEPNLDSIKSTFTITDAVEILELTSPEYRFETARFGFLQCWMRAPNRPDEYVESTSQSATAGSYGGHLNARNRLAADPDDLWITSYSGTYDATQLIFAAFDEDTQNTQGLNRIVAGEEFFTAHVCGIYNYSPSERAFKVDAAPPSTPRNYIYRLYPYAAIKPYSIGLHLVRHTDRGWYTSRPDEIAVGQTQTQIAFQTLANGDRALYGMRRPWHLLHDLTPATVNGQDTTEALTSDPLRRLVPMPRHADRLQHRVIALVYAWIAWNSYDYGTIPIKLRAEMVEPDEDVGIELYADFAGEIEAQAGVVIANDNDLDHALTACALPARAWVDLLSKAQIVSVVYGRNPDDPGVALGTATAPYLTQLTLTCDRPRTRARIFCASFWSEQV